MTAANLALPTVLANWKREDQEARGVTPITILNATARKRDQSLQRVNLFHRATITQAGVKRLGAYVAAQLDQ